METASQGSEQNTDSEHLKLLSIFHYVVGGMAALFACIHSKPKYKPMRAAMMA